VTRFKVGCERGRWLPDWFAKSGVGLWRFGEPVWCVSYDSRSGVTVWERDVADWGLKMKMVAGRRGMWLTGVWRWRWWERDVADRRLKIKMKMVGEGCGWLWSSRWRWIDFLQMWNCELWVVSCELWVVSCELRERLKRKEKDGWSRSMDARVKKNNAIFL
jgi:hypothetical protein